MKANKPNATKRVSEMTGHRLRPFPTVYQRPARIISPDDTEYDSKAEAAWGALLKLRKHAGDIVEYWPHGMKLMLAKGDFYTPDFLVQFAEHLEIHEVKGYMREDAREKLKIAVRKFYTIKFVVLWATWDKRKKRHAFREEVWSP